MELQKMGGGGGGGIEGKYFTVSTKHSELKCFGRRMNYHLKLHCKMFCVKIKNN
jgi:hypothetical protein